VARARWSQGVFDVAASVYDGKEITPLSGGDVSTDKTRLGADAQLYYEVPRVGGGSLKGEFYSGKGLNADSVKALVVAAGGAQLLAANADPSHLATDFTGGYAMVVQNLGAALQAAARVDWFDPNTDRDHDQYARTTLGLHWFYDGFTRVTVAYEIPTTDRKAGVGYVDPHDNLWTVQFQHRF
jgi:hypothetical protein